MNNIIYLTIIVCKFIDQIPETESNNWEFDFFFFIYFY